MPVWGGADPAQRDQVDQPGHAAEAAAGHGARRDGVDPDAVTAERAGQLLHHHRRRKTLDQLFSLPPQLKELLAGVPKYRWRLIVEEIAAQLERLQRCALVPRQGDDGVDGIGRGEDAVAEVGVDGARGEQVARLRGGGGRR